MSTIFLILNLFWPAAPAAERAMVITIDDLPANTTSDALEVRRQITLDLVAALRKAEIPAIGFVNEGKLTRDGAVAKAELDLLRHWLAHGLELGNHGYSHLDLHRVPLSEFLSDIRKGAIQTPRLAAALGLPYRYFRHPFLHTGRSAEDRAEVNQVLKELGLEVAPVTIDNGEWIYARAYDRALEAGELALAQKLRDDYLRYMEAVTAYYEDQSAQLLGYELPQILLLHANRLNAATLTSMISMLQARDYKFVSLSKALEDPAFGLEDAYFGQAGITWLHRWALTQRKPGSFFAGEPDVPAFVREASELNL